jgi:hypothetical protein
MCRSILMIAGLMASSMSDPPLLHIPDPLEGLVEPHAGLLRQPPDGQLLYKVMRVEHFLQSVEERYLHFNRVDGYGGIPDDGAQTPTDRPINAAAKFEKAPHFSGENYYDRARSRTYACSFSLENADHIWDTYGNGGTRGKVGVVFDFAKLRATLNRTLQADGVMIEHGGTLMRQMFSINYGLVKYVDWETYGTGSLPNPILYTYLKDEKGYSDDKELRISLSAIGVGMIVLADGREVVFPQHFHMRFDFRAAFADGTIREIMPGPGCDIAFLQDELKRLRVLAIDK